MPIYPQQAQGWAIVGPVTAAGSVAPPPLLASPVCPPGGLQQPYGYGQPGFQPQAQAQPYAPPTGYPSSPYIQSQSYAAGIPWNTSSGANPPAPPSELAWGELLQQLYREVQELKAKVIALEQRQLPSPAPPMFLHNDIKLEKLELKLDSIDIETLSGALQVGLIGYGFQPDAQTLPSAQVAVGDGLRPEEEEDGADDADTSGSYVPEA